MYPTRLLYGPALLVLWQTAPVAVRQDSTTGKLYLGLGAEAGSVEARELNCAGNTVGTTHVPYGSAGASLEAWPSDRVRISIAGSGLAVNHLRAEGNGVMMAAWEGKNFGAGVGLGVLSYPQLPVTPLPIDSDATPHADGHQHAVPSIYLRLGRRENLHFQAELMPPTETVSTTGYVRIGVGAADIGSQHISALTGFTAGPYSNGQYEFRWFGDVMIPVQDRIDLGVRLMAGPGYADPTTGIGLVGRYRFGAH